jgi:acid phosphatase family membrane protein YuiD
MFRNYWFVSGGAGWLIAQLLKVLTGMFKERKFSLGTLLFSTGGMPSSHTACVVALTTSSIVACGFASFEFAISFFFAMVVMIDAMGVRRETGEQAKLLNRMVENLFEQNTELVNEDWRKFKELVGHTPIQVLAGAGVGLCVPLLLLLTPWF